MADEPHNEKPRKITNGDIIDIDNILHITDKIYRFEDDEGQRTYTKRYFYLLRNGETLLIPWSLHHALMKLHKTTQHGTYTVHVTGTGTHTRYGVTTT